MEGVKRYITGFKIYSDLNKPCILQAKFRPTGTSVTYSNAMCYHSSYKKEFSFCLGCLWKCFFKRLPSFCFRKGRILEDSELWHLERKCKYYGKYFSFNLISKGLLKHNKTFLTCLICSVGLWKLYIWTKF